MSYVMQHDSTITIRLRFMISRLIKKCSCTAMANTAIARGLHYRKMGIVFTPRRPMRKKCTINLIVLDTKTGSTKSNTTKVNKITDSVEINSVFQLPDSEGLVLQGESFLIRADRDANLSTISDDEDHAFANDYSSWACDYYPVYIGNGSSDLCEEDDDDYYLNEQDASLGVYRSANVTTSSARLLFPLAMATSATFRHDGGCHCLERYIRR
ncbi:MAG: hypothetical protein ACLU7D_03930 [Collinsella sp.]